MCSRIPSKISKTYFPFNFKNTGCFFLNATQKIKIGHRARKFIQDAF